MDVLEKKISSGVVLLYHYIFLAISLKPFRVALSFFFQYKYLGMTSIYLLTYYNIYVDLSHS